MDGKLVDFHSLLTILRLISQKYIYFFINGQLVEAAVTNMECSWAWKIFSSFIKPTT